MNPQCSTCEKFITAPAYMFLSVVCFHFMLCEIFYISAFVPTFNTSDIIEACFFMLLIKTKFCKCLLAPSTEISIPNTYQSMLAVEVHVLETLPTLITSWCPWNWILQLQYAFNCKIILK